MLGCSAIIGADFEVDRRGGGGGRGGGIGEGGQGGHCVLVGNSDLTPGKGVAWIAELQLSTPDESAFRALAHADGVTGVVGVVGEQIGTSEHCLKAEFPGESFAAVLDGD